MERIFSSGHAQCAWTRAYAHQGARSRHFGIVQTAAIFTAEAAESPYWSRQPSGRETTEYQRSRLPSFRGGRVRRGASEFTLYCGIQGQIENRTQLRGTGAQYSGTVEQHGITSTVQKRSASSATVGRRRYAEGGGAFRSPALQQESAQARVPRIYSGTYSIT